MKSFSKKKIIFGMINAIDNDSAKAFNTISTININTENFKLGSKNLNILLIVFIHKNSI